MRKLVEFFTYAFLVIMALCTYQVTHNLIDRLLRGFEQEIILAKSSVARLEYDKREIDIKNFKRQFNDEDRILEAKDNETLTRLEMAKRDLRQKEQDEFYVFFSEHSSSSALAIAIALWLFPILTITKFNSRIQALESQLDQLRNPTVNNNEDDGDGDGDDDDDEEEEETEEDEEPEKDEVPTAEVTPPPSEPTTSTGGTRDGGGFKDS